MVIILENTISRKMQFMHFSQKSRQYQCASRIDEVKDKVRETLTLASTIQR